MISSNSCFALEGKAAKNELSEPQTRIKLESSAAIDPLSLDTLGVVSNSGETTQFSAYCGGGHVLTLTTDQLNDAGREYGQGRDPMGSIMDAIKLELQGECLKALNCIQSCQETTGSSSVCNPDADMSSAALGSYSVSGTPTQNNDGTFNFSGQITFSTPVDVWCKCSGC